MDIEGWAEATGVEAPELLAYTQTSHDLFKRDGENLALQMMFEEQWHEEIYEEAVMDYVGKMNVRFFPGRITSRMSVLWKNGPAMPAIKSFNKTVIIFLRNTRTNCCRIKIWMIGTL